MQATAVELSLGRLEGEQRGGHLAFRGIPFAAPPVGPLRFLPPRPAEPWKGTRPAVEFGPSAPQPRSQTPGMEPAGPRSEDCLYLNVFTPATDATRRPVMVWIHGGGFTSGSSSQRIYDGGPLAERGDVVVVTINYRLGVLGYLYLEEQGGRQWGATPNAGQLDMIAALGWVRDNVAAFGGNPGDVTVFGESAGAFAIWALLAMPAAQGLFHKAIVQSGAPRVSDPARAAAIAAALVEKLGIAHGHGRELQDVPVERLLEAQPIAARDAGILRGYYPVADGVTLPRPVDAAVASGEAARVPLLAGTTRDEVNLFVPELLRDLDRPMEDARAIEILRKELPEHAADRVPAMLETYRRSRSALGLPHGNRALLGAIQTDFRFRVPMLRLVEAHRAHQPRTYMYLFSYESPAMRGALRACHALELSFVFGTLAAPMQDRFAGSGPEVERLSERMMDAWIAFARSGNPSHPSLGDWPPYDTARRATMVFNRQSRLEDAPLEVERAAWDGI